MLSEMKGSARPGLICRHCGGEVTATGPAPVIALGGAYLGPYAHASTGLEVAADGHTASPLDPDLKGSVTAPKPTVADLGIDVASLSWQRSGDGPGSLEVAFPEGEWERGDWVVVRVDGDSSGLVSVFDRNEWECFLDGARNGEFDDAAQASPAM